MSNYLVNIKCDPEDGLDYIFVKMSGIYGAAFMRNWEGLDMLVVRQVWAQELGRYLIDKKILDFALNNLPPDRPPSAIAFRNLCKESPDIFDLETLKGVNALAHKMGEKEYSHMEAFHIFQKRMLDIAKERGVL